MWDIVGRCIAESEACGAQNVRVVTLTYGNSSRIAAVPNEFAAVSVVKRDLQLWIKRIRKAGHQVRYLAAAEFGPLNARVHWHCLLFFYPLKDNSPAKSQVPDIPLEKRNYGGDVFWQDGITYWQAFTTAAAVYVCKYLLKSQNEENRLNRGQRVDQKEAANYEWSTMSKKPPLGAEFFKRRAERFVEAQLAPQDLYYKFPEVREKQSGKIRRFYMGKGSASADLFLQHYLDMWRARYPDRYYPASELVDEFRDRTEPRPDTVNQQADRLGTKDRPKPLTVDQVRDRWGDKPSGVPMRLDRKAKRLTAAQREHNRQSRAYRRAIGFNLPGET